MIHAPPQDVAPEVLFRRLLQTPRPSLPVAISLPGVSGGAFCVQAVSGQEILVAQYEAKGQPDALRSSYVTACALSLGLYDDGERVFSSGAEAGLLDEDDFVIVAAAVLPALYSISPAYGISDTAAWESRLLVGAQHATNRHTAWRLGGCRDRATLIAPKGKGLLYEQVSADRPDRYFGLPLGELTDGHWLCYRAARRMIEASK